MRNHHFKKKSSSLFETKRKNCHFKKLNLLKIIQLFRYLRRRMAIVVNVGKVQNNFKKNGGGSVLTSLGITGLQKNGNLFRTSHEKKSQTGSPIVNKANCY